MRRLCFNAPNFRSFGAVVRHYIYFNESPAAVAVCLRNNNISINDLSSGSNSSSGATTKTKAVMTMEILVDNVLNNTQRDVLVNRSKYVRCGSVSLGNTVPLYLRLRLRLFLIQRNITGRVTPDLRHEERVRKGLA